MSTTLADLLDYSRSMTKFYLGHLKDVDMKRRYDANGVLLNAPLWICAHLAWAEQSMIAGALGNVPNPYDWLDTFGIESSGEPTDTWPEFEEVRSAMDAIHRTSVDVLRSLSDEELTAVIPFPLFGRDVPKRTIVFHAIRHEGAHAGHLGWLCKLHGIHTI